jgi:hypothetical protein
MQSKDQIIKREKMFALIEEWQQSGQSQRQFCIENDIPYHMFIYYHTKYKQQAHDNQDGFLPMEITGDCSQGNFGEIEIHYPNGTMVRLPGAMNMKVLTHLINL